MSDRQNAQAAAAADLSAEREASGMQPQRDEVTGGQLSAPADLPTKHGKFKIRAFQDAEGRDHVVVYKGEPADLENVPLRIHSQCLTSEVFHSMRCDCSQQLAAALDYFEREGIGVLVYLRQEGRGIGLFNKIQAYTLQDGGLDTVEANAKLGLPDDARTYEVAIAILRLMSIRSVRLMTNNPLKIDALKWHDFQVTERIPIAIEPNPFNGAYLNTKKTKMDHLL